MTQQQAQEPDPLRPMLNSVEGELERRLEEACARHDVHDESTAELMRLEETLLDAARVAKQAVSLRRRLRSETEAADDDADEAPEIPETGAPPVRSAGDTGVRELRDAQGVEWRIWAVTAQQMQASRSGGEHLGEYKDGWLTFEAVAGNERRRLPHYPSDWNEITDEMLTRLLERADPVRRSRKPATEQSEEQRT